MFGFDVFPVAAASLDMTADFAPLLLGLNGVLMVSAAGIVIGAISSWFLHQRRATTIPVAIESSPIEPQEQAKAA